MTKKEYQDNGFRLSLQVEQAEIDRAEREVTIAYLKPIAPAMTTSDKVYANALMTLAFLWILQHSVFATRAGAKTVQITSANTPQAVDVLRECVWDCHNALQALKVASGAKDDVKVFDVCRIYFTTNYFGI